MLNSSNFSLKPGRRSALTDIVLWSVAHGGVLISVLTKWEPTNTYRVLAIMYIALLAMATTLLWLALRPFHHVWLRKCSEKSLPIGLWWIVVGVLFVLWLLPLQPVYPVNALRWLLTTIVMLVSVPLLRSRPSLLSLRVLVIVGVGAALAVSLLSLQEYPKIYVDEGISINKAWVASYEGIRYTPTINLGVRGDPQLVNTEFNYWAIGLWLRAAGLGIFQGRFSAWLCWLVTAVLIFFATRRLFGWQAGVIACLFIGTSEIALYTSHFIRPEMYLNVLMALALAIFTQVERRKRFADGVLLGLVLSLATTIHVYALLYCVGFGAFYTLRWLLETYKRHHFYLDSRLVGLALGGIIGAVVYSAIYVLPNPAAFREQTQFYYAINYGTGKSWLSLLPVHAISIVNHFRVWYAASLPEASAVLVSATAILLYRRRGSALLVIFVFILLAWIGLGSYSGLTYVSVLLPITAPLVGVAIVQFFAGRTPASQHNANNAFVPATLLLVAMFGVTTPRAFYPQPDNNRTFNRQFESCIQALHQNLPEHAMILGDPLFWLARPTFSQYGTKDLINNPWPGRTPAQWVAWINPDIVLWPGPVTGATADYVLSHRFQLIDAPVCRDVVMIWANPDLHWVWQM